MEQMTSFSVYYVSRDDIILSSKEDCQYPIKEKLKIKSSKMSKICMAMWMFVGTCNQK